jgi:hypothetical protein
MNKFNKIFFVSNEGNNEIGDGSFDAPFLTLQYAMSQVEIDEPKWFIVPMSGLYNEPGLTLQKNVTIQAMISNTVTITSPIIFSQNGTYNFIGINFLTIDNYTFTCTNNLILDLHFQNCNFTASPTVDSGCGIFNIDNCNISLFIENFMLKITNYQELVSIISTTVNSVGTINLNNGRINAIKGYDIQYDAPLILLNGNVKLNAYNTEFDGKILIEHNSCAIIINSKLNGNLSSVITTNSTGLTQVINALINLNTNPVIDGVGVIQVSQCCFLKNGQQFSPTLNNNTGIYYLPTTSPRLAQQELPKSIQGGAIYYAQGEFYDDKISRFKLPTADKNTGIIDNTQLPLAKYGQAGTNYLISVRKNGVKQSIIDLEAGTNMDIVTDNGIATFNASGKIDQNIKSDTLDIVPTEDGLNINLIVDNVEFDINNKILSLSETVVERLDKAGTALQRVNAGDNVEITEPINNEQTISAINGGGGVTPAEAEAIAQANFDTNIIPINENIVTAQETANQAETNAQSAILKANNAQIDIDDLNALLTENDTIAKANSALQEIESGTGIKMTTKTNNKQTANLQPATDTTIGGVKPDGTTTTVSANGTISSTGGSSGGNVVIQGLYKQFVWNNLINLTTFNQNIIPQSSLFLESSRQIFYNSSATFCLTGMLPVKTSGSIPLYVFVGQWCCSKTSALKFNYFTGETVDSLSDLQTAQTTTTSLPIYMSNKTYTVSNISVNDVVSFSAFAKKITLSLKQQGLTKFRCYFNNVENKMQMANLGDETFQNITGSSNLLSIASGINRGNDQIINNNNLVYQATDGVPYVNNNIWMSNSFTNNDILATNNMDVDLGWNKFKVNLSKFANYNSFYNILIEYNVVLINIVPVNPTATEEFKYLPNLITQNFAGNPYFPTRYIQSSYLGNGNVSNYSPINTLIYNYWDYQQDGDNTVKYFFDTNKFKHLIENGEMQFTFLYQSAVIGDNHNVRFMFDSKGINAFINSGSTYYEKTVSITTSDYSIENIIYNNNEIPVYVARTVFNVVINNGIVSIFSLNDEISNPETLQIANWDSTINYKINDIVALNGGIFRAVANSINNNPWSTNAWVSQGNENTYHLTENAYNMTTGVNLIMIQAPIGENVEIETPLLTNVLTPYEVIIKCCQLTNGKQIDIHTPTGSQDLFEDGSNVITISDKSDVISLIFRPGETKIFFGN